MPERSTTRKTSAIGILILSTWTFARVISKWDIHWTFFVLACTAVGIVIGAIANNIRGALIGGTVGLVVSVPLLFFDMLLWLVLSLPPHLNVDF